jgi:hypothetical protein
MATPRRTAQGQRTRGKLPRLTRQGRSLSPQEQAENINNWIQDEFEEELRLTALLDVNTRRQIRLATGVGDMDTFVDEFNQGFANSSQLLPEKSNPTKGAFGEPWSDRPKLKKISQEARITFRPKRK